MKTDNRLKHVNHFDKKAILERAKQDPVWFITELLGANLCEYQKSIVNSIRDNQITAVKSGHALGKDYIAGLISLWYLYTHKDSLVITTAPTGRQVKRIMWGEIKKAYYNSKIGQIGKMLDIELRISPNWYAIGVSTKDSNDAQGKFQGFHSSSGNIMVVMTEAQAIEDNIYEQSISLLNTDRARMYIAGNPLRSDGFFYRLFGVDNNIKQHTLSCFISPNVKLDQQIIAGLVSKKWVDDRGKEWGIDSPLYQARVLGEFPDKSLNTMISMSALVNAIGLTEYAKGLDILGCDPARFGDDATVISYVSGGKLNFIDKTYGKATTETRDRLIDLCTKNHVDKIIIDAGTFGAGIIDMLNEYKIKYEQETINKFPEIIGFNFGGKPDDNTFANRGTECYFKVCDLIDNGQVSLINDKEFLSQTSSRHYEFNVAGRMILEPKDKMKARGQGSPDTADSVVMALSESILEIDNELNEDGELIDYGYLEAKENSITGYINNDLYAEELN